MPDRIPIGTIPGLVSQLAVGPTDILVATLGVAGTVARIFLRHTDYDDGGATDTSVVGSIRNATGGGGDGIAFTIVDQTQSITVDGALAVSASESIYLRVTTGGVSMNLTGWVELTGAAAAVTALTNLSRVKEFLGITVTTDDALINHLIESVSDEIQQSQAGVNRPILQATATDEKVDVPVGGHLINTRHYPIISIASLAENDAALVEDTDFEIEEQDKERGQVARISGSAPMSWVRGTRIVKLTYDYGFAAIPQALEQAATELVAFDYRQSQPGGARFGLANKPIDEGGSPTFLARADIWEAQAHRFEAYRRSWV